MPGKETKVGRKIKYKTWYDIVTWHSDIVRWVLRYCKCEREQVESRETSDLTSGRQIQTPNPPSQWSILLNRERTLTEKTCGEILYTDQLHSCDVIWWTRIFQIISSKKCTYPRRGRSYPRISKKHQCPNQQAILTTFSASLPVDQKSWYSW